MKITNKYGLPEPFVQALVKNYRPTPNRYGVTTLLKGATQTVLERRFHDEISMDASEGIFMIFGTAVHQILENSGISRAFTKNFGWKYQLGMGSQSSPALPMFMTVTQALSLTTKLAASGKQRLEIGRTTGGRSHCMPGCSMPMVIHATQGRLS